MLQGFANSTRIVDRYHVYFQNIGRLRRISITNKQAGCNENRFRQLFHPTSVNDWK